MPAPAPTPSPASLLVDGRRIDVALVGHETLLAVLGERLLRAGAGAPCGRGECGACAVLLDGEPAYACLTLAAACDGVAVTTTTDGDARDPDG